MKFNETTACVELGLSAPSSMEEVRKAYKNLARKLHPDVGGDEERFKRVSIAYQFLVDLYDKSPQAQAASFNQTRSQSTHDHQQAWQAWRQQNQSHYQPSQQDTYQSSTSRSAKSAYQSHASKNTRTSSQASSQASSHQTASQAHEQAQHVDVVVIHNWKDQAQKIGKKALDNLGQYSRDLGDKITTWYKNKASTLYEKGKDEKLKLSIDQSTLLHGKTQRIAIYRLVACPHCQSQKDNKQSKGQAAIPPLLRAQDCTICKGEARVSQREELSIYIPPGADQGHKLKVSGKGRASLNQSADGDLYLLLQPPSLPKGFKRKGADLYLQLGIPQLKLNQGGSVSFDSPHGALNIKVPAQFQSGKVLKVSKKGLPHWGAEEQWGDLWITIYAQS